MARNTNFEDCIKLRHLRVVAAVESCNGISAAAAALGVSPAAISKAVAEAETALGIDLFERHGRGVRLTPAGQLFVSAARIVSKELSVLGTEIRLMQTGDVGALTIGVQAVASEQLMMKAISRFKIFHPRALVRVVDGVLANLLVDLRGGRLDLVIGRLIPDMLALDLEGLPLIDDSYVAVASQHLARRAELSDWAQALEEFWCLPPPGTPVTNAFAAFLASHNLPYPDRLVETRTMHFISLLLNELPACALVPNSLLPGWRDRMGVRPLSLPLELKLKPLGLIWSKRLPISPAAAAFRDIVGSLSEVVANI
jgi:DNA-binding transcriptional LysR family regulator